MSDPDFEPMDEHCSFCGFANSELVTLWYSDTKRALYCKTPCLERATRIRDAARLVKR